MKRLSLLSAISALVLWAIVFSGGLGGPSAQALASWTALVLLLLPAAGTALAVGGLRSMLALPRKVLALPSGVAGGAQDVVRGLRGARTGRPGLLGFLSVLWRMRGVVGASRGGALRVAGMARLARLLSLPFALVLSAAFLLNFAVIGGAAAAVLFWLL